MENEKITEAKHRTQRGRSIDVACMFHRRSSFEMQNATSPCGSADDFSELKKRLRNKSWANGPLRKTSVQVEKRSQSSKAAYHDRRPSQPAARYNGHKTGRWQTDYMKLNVPKRWLREYEKKQVRVFSRFQKQSDQEPCRQLYL